MKIKFTRQLRKNFRRYCLLILLKTLSIAGISQADYYHKPFVTYNNRDTVILHQVKRQFDTQIKKIVPPYVNQIAKIYRSIHEDFIINIKQEKFLKDDFVESYLRRIVDRIVQSNNLSNPYKILLIQNTSSINANCLADGSIIIDLGLLAKLESESELAMALAHEMAHFELQHARKAIAKYVEMENKKEQNQRFKIFPKTNEDEDIAYALKEFRKLMYKISSLNRQNEQQADSLGLLYMMKSGYDSEGAVLLMRRLDHKKESDEPNFDFMLQLDLKNFPLQEDWFRKMPRILFNPIGRSEAFFQNDSLETHPDLDKRAEYLKTSSKRLKECCFSSGIQTIYNPLPYETKFQLIETCLKGNIFDRSLYHALALRDNFKQNAYLTASVTKVFIELYERRNFQPKPNAKPISLFTMNYSEELRLVNEFLHNVPSESLDEISLNFLLENFDDSCEEHYYLMWRIYRMNSNKVDAKSIRDQYIGRFPEGSFNRKMEKYTPYEPPKSSLKELLRGY